MSGETYIGTEEKHKGHHLDLRVRAVYQFYLSNDDPKTNSDFGVLRSAIT